MRRLQRILFLCCLEGRRMDIPHTYFVFASRIYACYVWRYVASFGLGRGDCFNPENRLTQTYCLDSYVYVRLCIYGAY